MQRNEDFSDDMHIFLKKFYVAALLQHQELNSSQMTFWR